MADANDNNPADDGRPGPRGPDRSKNPDIVVRRGRNKQLDVRWFLYPAYILTFVAGGIAANFATGSEEWKAGPVGVAWGILFLWYWLYGVAFRYRRPVLKYFSLAAALGFGGLLTAFCLDRVPPQLVAQSDGGAQLRGLLTNLLWAGLMTGVSAFIVVVHSILFSRAE